MPFLYNFVFCCFLRTCSLGRKHYFFPYCLTVLYVSLNFSVFSPLVHPVVLLNGERSAAYETLTPAVSDYINRVSSRDDTKSSRSVRLETKQNEVRLNKLINAVAGASFFFQSQYDHCQQVSIQNNHDLVLMNSSLPAIIIAKRPYSKCTADCNEALSKDSVEPYLIQSLGRLNYLTGRAAAL